MDLWNFIIVIVLIGCSYSLIETWMKSKSHKATVNDLTRRIQALESRDSSQLEERVVNLEKIVTDKKFGLSDEINNL